MKHNNWIEIERQLAFLFDFEKERVTTSPKQFSLKPLQDFLQALGLKDYPIPIIQVVGSKGKGTVATMTEAILRSQGLNTGLYVSPHVVHRKERIQVNGSPLSDEDWQKWVSMLLAHHEDLTTPLSRFEFETALAFTAFAHSDVDVVIMEAGLGGLYDATSALPAQLVVLTSIEKEHTAVLGETIQEIASQKIGMLPSQASLLTGPVPAKAQTAIAQTVKKRSANLYLASTSQDQPKPHFQLVQSSPTPEGNSFLLETDINGSHRQYEGSVSMFGPHIPMLTTLSVGASILFLQKQSSSELPPKSLESLKELSLVGRLQRLSPSLILDVAHTPRSVEASCQACLNHYGQFPDTILLGLNEDKEIDEILRILLERTQRILLVPLPSPRSASPPKLSEHIRKLEPSTSKELDIKVFSSLAQGWSFTLEESDNLGLVLALGSFSLVGAILLENRAG